MHLKVLSLRNRAKWIRPFEEGQIRNPYVDRSKDYFIPNQIKMSYSFFYVCQPIGMDLLFIIFFNSLSFSFTTGGVTKFFLPFVHGPNAEVDHESLSPNNCREFEAANFLPLIFLPRAGVEPRTSNNGHSRPLDVLGQAFFSKVWRRALK